ncbi:MAG: hypothetical protein QT08_C0013G0035 [archaeon GW2011_AR17]|nr:MAG: hypothetical protein QT08_C0013G0035 [archaeon GW2011_AR17]MBS3153877.1 hypothetical protein [Candidatus Woesearchaeota archaeon]HIH15478.1 hypothetical protein [Nanoarchaeota archaeon]HIH59281.1 hypothetical protein [Nanoarchaeota archaeon]HII13924.1 hypothetical protein [Nanoarchaeota archaeon]
MEFGATREQRIEDCLLPTGNTNEGTLNSIGVSFYIYGLTKTVEEGEKLFLSLKSPLVYDNHRIVIYTTKNSDVYYIERLSGITF